MPTGPGEKLGEAYVQIGTKLDALSSGLARAESMVKSTMSRIGGLFIKIGAGIGAGFGLGILLKTADDLSKSYNYAGLVFGDFSKVVISESERISSKFGASRRELVQGASEIGEVFRRIGATPSQAARLTTELVPMAAAIARVRDIDLSEALKAIEYGLEGSTRCLRRLGITLREDQVEFEAFRLGLVKIGGTFSESDLAIARASLLMRMMGNTTKVLENSQLPLSSKFAAAWAKVRHAIEDTGTAFLPIAHRIIDYVNLLAGRISDWVASHRSDMDYFVSSTLSAFDQVTGGMTIIYDTISKIGNQFGWLGDIARDVFETIGAIWRNWSLIAERTGIMVMGGIINIGETFSWLQSTISAFLDWFATSWRSVFTDSFNAVITALTNLGENFRDFGRAAYDWIASGFSKPFEFKMTPVMKGFAATTPGFKAPELKLSSIQDQLAEVDAKMLKVEEKRLDELKKEKPKVPEEKKVEEGKKALEYPPPFRKPTTAEFVGVSEFWKKIQTGALSGQPNYQQQIAAWTKRTAEATEALLTKDNAGQVANAAGPF